MIEKDKGLRNSEKEEPFNGEINGETIEVIRNYRTANLSDNEKQRVREDFADTRKVQYTRENDLYKKGREVDVDKGPPEEVLVDNGTRGLQLRRRDLQTLSGKNLLNDKIVNQYVELIKKRNEADSSLPSIYVTDQTRYQSSPGTGRTKLGPKASIRLV